MSLLSNIQLETLQGMTPAEIKALPCVDVINKNGDYIATLVVPMTDFVKVQTEFLSVKSNAIWSGEFEDETPKPEPEPEREWYELLREPNPSEFICSKCKALHRRSDTTKNGKHAKDYEWVAPSPPTEEA